MITLALVLLAAASGYGVGAGVEAARHVVRHASCACDRPQAGGDTP